MQKRGRRKNMRVYLSGKISGNKNYYNEFLWTHSAINIFYWNDDYDIINPVNLNKEGTERIKCMRNDIFHLLDCTHIAMVKAYYFKIIPKWWFSKGARLERVIAKQVGIKVLKY
jgi:hypothetical protein